MPSEHHSKTLKLFRTAAGKAMSMSSSEEMILASDSVGGGEW